MRDVVDEYFELREKLCGMLATLERLKKVIH